MVDDVFSLPAQLRLVIDSLLPGIVPGKLCRIKVALLAVDICEEPDIDLVSYDMRVADVLYPLLSRCISKDRFAPMLSRILSAHGALLVKYLQISANLGIHCVSIDMFQCQRTVYVPWPGYYCHMRAAEVGSGGLVSLFT